MTDWIATFAPLSGPAAALASWWIKSALVLAAGALAARLLRRRSAAARHLVWTLSVVTVLALPLASGLLPRLAFELPEPVAEAGGALRAAPVQVMAQEASAPAEPTALRSGEGAPVAASGGAPAAAPSPEARGWALPIPGPAALAATGLALWLAGVLFLLLRAMVDRRARRRIIGRAAPWPVEGPEDRELLAGRLRRLRLLRSPDAPVPMTWGVLRPVVVLPAEAERWTETRRRHVLLHEIAHVRRLDVLWQSLADLLCALAWIDPLTWVARRALRREAELACDDAVLVSGERASSYAGNLLQAARDLQARRRRPRAAALPRASVAMARSPEIGGRIAAILQADRRRQPVGAPRALLAVLAALAVALPLAALSPAAEAEPHPAPHPEAGADDDDRRVHRTHETDEPKRGYFTAPRYADQCAPGLLTGRRFGAIVNAADDEWKIDVFHGLCELEIEMEGDVELRPDGRGIERMGRGARMTIEEDAGIDRTLVVTPGSNGVPQYRFRVDGRERPIDDQARAWFRGVLTEVFRVTGLQAEERIAHLLEQGGVPAVLAEVEHITSDHVAGLYFHATLARHRVSAAEAAKILELAGETLGSDHTLSELMMAVPTELLSDRRVRDAYVGASRSIGSDHDLSRVLIELIDRGRTDRATVEAILRAAGGIGSDHDLSRLLVRIAEEVTLDGDLRQQYLDRAEDVGSDHDHDRVISALNR